MSSKHTLSKRTLISSIIVLILIPVTMYIGITYFNDRKYYLISTLILLYTIIPFFLVFESRKPKARELILIAVLSAIGVAGRGAFFFVPQFKPVAAIVIISGLCLGAETGFLVGAMTAFVSNFFFGQGPHTPWQMFAFGLIGFLTGILHTKGILKSNRIVLSIYGFIVTFIIYGGIMNPASVIMFAPKPNKNMIIAAYVSGIPFDLVHAAATAFFLFIISEPMIEKIDRIKIKYGLLEKDI